MQSPCAKCGKQLEAAWTFCPGCGAAADRAAHGEIASERAPVKGAFSGLLLGAIISPVMLIVGAMLCLTGLGAFLGVPMIIGGILAPLAGPLIGIDSLKGTCPWCGAPVTSLNGRGSFDCKACSKRIAVRDHRFVAAS